MSGDDYLDIEPGRYDADAGAFALVEQQRAAMIELLRTSKAVSLTLLDGEGDGRHWGVYIREDGDADPFLVYAAVKAVRDVTAALGVDHEVACRLILDAIDEGIGEGDK